MNNIQAVLSAMGKSRGWLARKTGLERSTITVILNKNRDVRVSTALKISKALDCRIEDLWSL